MQSFLWDSALLVDQASSSEAPQSTTIPNTPRLGSG